MSGLGRLSLSEPFDFARNDQAPRYCGQTSIVPSNTNSAGPVSVTFSKLLIDLFKSDPQFVPTASNYIDWTVHVFSGGKISALATTPVPHARVSSSTPSFVSADSDLIGSAFLNEVHVCAFW